MAAARVPTDVWGGGGSRSGGAAEDAGTGGGVTADWKVFVRDKILKNSPAGTASTFQKQVEARVEELGLQFVPEVVESETGGWVGGWV